MNQGSFELYVAVPSANGRSTKIREYGLHGRTFVEGRKGQPFSFVFKNNTAHRVLAVPSLDGISVIDGGPATDTSRGHVVPAYGTVEVKGWRTSLNGVASFYFEVKDGSYAAIGEVKDTRNVGVIAMNVFSEKAKPVPPTVIIKEHHHHHHDHGIFWPSSPPWQAAPTWCNTGGSAEYCASLNPQPDVVSMSSKKATLDFNLGAGFGAALEDRVTETTFEKEACVALLEIYYSDADGLRKAGVELHKEAAAISVPDFPQSFNGFCKPPVAK